jgi:hypothetical protein
MPASHDPPETATGAALPAEDGVEAGAEGDAPLAGTVAVGSGTEGTVDPALVVATVAPSSWRTAFRATVPVVAVTAASMPAAVAAAAAVATVTRRTRRLAALRLSIA